MHSSVDNSDLSPRELADLSALADGSLDPRRRAEVEQTIAASAELTALYERERRVVDLIQTANSEVLAPAGLRARIEASRPGRPARARRRVMYGGTLAGALAVLALALALILPGGTPGAPSVSQAAGLAMLGASSGAPGIEQGTPTRLETTIEGLYFPNWATKLHWRASGQRRDHINGRYAVTVYYDAGTRRVAYTIVGSPVLKAPAGAAVSNEGGVEYQSFTMNGRTVVTWRNAGHTCILSATGVSEQELQRLASWKVPAAA
jgi:hypothetical protein